MLIGRELVDVSEQDERRLVLPELGEERAKVGISRDDDAVVKSSGLKNRLVGRLAEVALEDVHRVMASGAEFRGYKW